MKILQVINNFSRGGGAEKVVFDLAIALSCHPNIEVSILSIQKPSDGEYVEEIKKKYGINTFCLSNRLKSFRNLFALKGYLCDDYDIIHVHLFPALYYISIAKMLFNPHATIIYTEHSTKNKRRTKWIFRMIDRFIYSRYNMVAAISSQVEANLRNAIKSNKIVVINNGIFVKQILDSPQLDLKRELSLSENVSLVTMVARFVKGKDYYTLFDSLILLPNNVHVVCVGNGALFDAAVEYVTRNDIIYDRVHFLGLRQDVVSILKASDIIVLSSEHEGFSIAMLEAMASQKPFVASEVEGLKDVALDAAIYFPYQNSSVLAERIIGLLNDSNLYHSMVSKSIQFAYKHDMSVIMEKYYNLYVEQLSIKK